MSIKLHFYKPEYGPSKIFFTINEKISFILYSIYKVDFENSRDIEYADTAFNSVEQVNVTVNHYIVIFEDKKTKATCSCC